jgi:hypothetical protein
LAVILPVADRLDVASRDAEPRASRDPAADMDEDAGRDAEARASRTPAADREEDDPRDADAIASRTPETAREDWAARVAALIASRTPDAARLDVACMTTDPSHVVGLDAEYGSSTTGEHGGCCAHSTAGASGVCARLAGAESCSPQPAIRRCRTPPRTG